MKLPPTINVWPLDVTSIVVVSFAYGTSTFALRIGSRNPFDFAIPHAGYGTVLVFCGPHLGAEVASRAHELMHSTGH